jgi:hypothetical protein
MTRKRKTQAELAVLVDELLKRRATEDEVLRRAYIAEGLDPDQPQVGKTVSLHNTTQGVRRYIRNGRIIAEFNSTREFLAERLRKK